MLWTKNKAMGSTLGPVEMFIKDIIKMMKEMDLEK
jgi:hypothetical protein